MAKHAPIAAVGEDCGAFSLQSPRVQSSLSAGHTAGGLLLRRKILHCLLASHDLLPHHRLQDMLYLCSLHRNSHNIRCSRHSQFTTLYLQADQLHYRDSTLFIDGLTRAVSVCLVYPFRNGEAAG